MPEPQPSLFRKEALENLARSSGQQPPLALVGTGSWLAWCGVAAVCAAVAAWAVWGRVPETVEGPGLLLDLGNVRHVEAATPGRIVAFRVVRGTTVREGDVLAVVDQTELRQELAQARERLAEFERVDGVQRQLEETRLAQERAVAATRRRVLEASLAEHRRLADEWHARLERSLAAQRTQLDEMTAQAGQLVDELLAQRDELRSLAERRLATKEQLLAAEGQLVDARLRRADLGTRRHDLETQDLSALERQFNLRTKAADLEVQLEQSALELELVEQEITRSRESRALEIQAQRNHANLLETQLAEQESIRSPHAGVVIEVAAQPGQVAAAGTRIATLSVSPASASAPLAPTRVLAYLPLAEGKRVAPGMEALVTPTTIERERYGSIVGRVTRVAPFPTTAEAAATSVGSDELVRALAARGAMIELEIELAAANTPSGYRWTSRGPDTQFTPGTLTTTRIVVAHRAPWSYVAPVVRTWVFGPSRPADAEPPASGR